MLSRVITHIDYIEDIDSLRFALGVQDYDVANYQPHFPAYPVFCFLVKSVYTVSGNLGISFAVIGGIATFLIAYYLPFLLSEKPSLILSLLVVTNPLIWLLANRFMPDLLGLGFIITSLVYYKRHFTNPNKYNLKIAAILTALLIGVRLSYLPLLFLPILVLIYKTPKATLEFLVVGTIGVLFWLIPLIVDTGWNNLVDVAKAQTDGHFNTFGGTVINEPDILSRLKATGIYIWADGLGGWLPHRHWVTIGLSVLLSIPVICFPFFLSGKLNRWSKVLLGSIIVYFLWALFFQNVLYKSRHILPFIPFFLVFLYHAASLFPIRKLLKLGYMFLLICISLLVTVPLVLQHMRPTAIEKVSRYISAYNGPVDLIGPKLLEKRMSLVLKSDFRYFVETSNEVDAPRVFTFTKKELTGYQFLGDTTFYHNPYVNRMWSEATLYQYIKLDASK